MAGHYVWLYLDMFKHSTNHQGDIFKNLSGQLSGRKQKMLDSAHEWHNVFYNEVVSQIDESRYSVLYHDRMGRPNASVRVLIGMMIIKEGQGWSDEQLFDESRFNLRVMRALGFCNIDDDTPSESTYYEFRRLLGEYTKRQDHDLLKETFTEITIQQAATYGVSGKKIRLDSKLINSNIARSNRLHMIVEAVRKYVRELNLDNLRDNIDTQWHELLDRLQNKSTSNITYSLTAQEKGDMLVTMGALIQLLLDLPEENNSKYYKLLERVYDEQYEKIGDDDKGSNESEIELPKSPLKKELLENQGIVVPKAPKDIPSSSVQSVHDPEAAYRTKGQGVNKQTVAGFHANITESCDPDEAVHLILDVDVVPANVSEDVFLIPSVEASQKIIEQTHDNDDANGIKEAITDGGYDSIENREKMLEDDYPIWSMAKMKGGRRMFQIEYNDAGNLEVFDIKSGDQLEVHYSPRAQKYVIQLVGGGKRYMTTVQIENYIKRQQIEDQATEESYNLRATVESTIHQTFHRLKKNNKMVYRGMIKCQWYVLSRAFWVNIVRITDGKQKSLRKTAIYLLLNILHSLRSLILQSTIKSTTSFCLCIYCVK